MELISRTQLAALPRPTTFAHREQRYRGDSQTISLASLPAEDREILREVYGFLVALKEVVEPSADAAATLERLAGFLLERGYDALPDRVGRLGARLAIEDLPPEIRSAYHDLRGGSLQAIVMHLDLVAEGEGRPEDLQRLHLLVRDQLKIMRNAARDLDPDAYARDLMPKGHPVSLLEEKWASATYPGRDRPVRVRLHNEAKGDVSECCMEFSALDRVLYNLVNNAARFAADGVVELAVLPVDEGRQLRFVVVNRVEPAHRERLVATFGGEDLREVLRGGFTTGGHGVGTRICSEFVAHGYGLGGVSEVLEGGYAGARLVEDTFVTWFHWPALADG